MKASIVEPTAMPNARWVTEICTARAVAIVVC